MEVILSSLISAASAIIVCVVTVNANHRRMLSELEKRDELQMYRIEQLEKKVDKHNNLVERTYQLERVADVHEEKLRVANHRIDDLEDKTA